MAIAFSPVYFMNNAYTRDEEWDDADLAESESCALRRSNEFRWDAVVASGKKMKSRPILAKYGEVMHSRWATGFISLVSYTHVTIFQRCASSRAASFARWNRRSWFCVSSTVDEMHEHAWIARTVRGPSLKKIHASITGAVRGCHSLTSRPHPLSFHAPGGEINGGEREAIAFTFLFVPLESNSTRFRRKFRETSILYSIVFYITRVCFSLT